MFQFHCFPLAYLRFVHLEEFINLPLYGDIIWFSSKGDAIILKNLNVCIKDEQTTLCDTTKTVCGEAVLKICLSNALKIKEK